MRTMQKGYIAVLLFFFLPATNGYSATLQHSLPEFTAKYAITKYGIKLAEAVYALAYTRNGYKMTQHTRLYGVAALFMNDRVDASSLVENMSGKLLLTEFFYRQTGREKNRDEDIHLSYRKSNNTEISHITGISRGRPVDIKTQGPVWDILSFQIPLMIQADSKKKNYPYTAVINGKLDKYTFRLQNTKTVRFAGTNYQLLEVVRSNKERTRVLHIWLAPKLHNLPVIVENYHDGNLHSRMSLESVQFNHAPQLIKNNNIDVDD